MLMYESAIVDECGSFIAWCGDLSEKEIEEILDRHSETKRTSIEMGAYDDYGCYHSWKGDCYESD